MWTAVGQDSVLWVSCTRCLKHEMKSGGGHVLPQCLGVVSLHG